MKLFYCYPIFLALLTCSQTEGTRLSKVPSAAKSIDNPSLMGTLKRYKKTFCGLGMGALLILLVILIKKYMLEDTGKHTDDAAKYRTKNRDQDTSNKTQNTGKNNIDLKKINNSDIPVTYTSGKYLKQIVLNIVMQIDDEGTISAPPKEHQLVQAMKKIEFIQFVYEENLTTKEVNWGTAFLQTYGGYIHALIKAINGAMTNDFLDDIRILRKLVGIKKKGDDRFIPIYWEKIKEDIPEYPTFN